MSKIRIENIRVELNEEKIMSELDESDDITEYKECDCENIESTRVKDVEYTYGNCKSNYVTIHLDVCQECGMVHSVSF